MKVYRGTRDFLPQDLNHRKLKDAVYGEATYFALNFDDALHYSNGGYGYCAVVTSYELYINSKIEIHENEWDDISCISNASKERSISEKLKNLLKLEETKLKPKDLSKVLIKNNIDCAILKGKFEGGEQLVLPNNTIQPIPIEYYVRLGSNMIGRNKENSQKELFIKSLDNYGIKVIDTGYYLEFTLSPLQLIQIEELLNFLQVCRNQSFISIDYQNMKVEELDYN